MKPNPKICPIRRCRVCLGVKLKSEFVSYRMGQGRQEGQRFIDTICLSCMRLNSKIWRAISGKEYYDSRAPEFREKVARYVIRKRNATPLWADDELILEVYRLAELRTKLTGINWQVDHVEPLQADYVCGLHVEQNLQVIPAGINYSKRNRYSYRYKWSEFFKGPEC